MMTNKERNFKLGDRVKYSRNKTGVFIRASDSSDPLALYIDDKDGKTYWRSLDSMSLVVDKTPEGVRKALEAEVKACEFRIMELKRFIAQHDYDEHLKKIWTNLRRLGYV